MEKRVDSLEIYTKEIIGLTITEVWKGVGSTIFLELGDLFIVEGDKSLERKYNICFDWEWRLEKDNQIILGSSNSYVTIDKNIKVLENLQILDIHTFGPVNDIEVRLSDNYILRSMINTKNNDWRIKWDFEGQYIYSYHGEIFIGEGHIGFDTEFEEEESQFADETTKRWGTPKIEPVLGKCINCEFLLYFNSDSHFLGYGVCTNNESNLDGCVVSEESGCPYYLETID